MAFAVVSDLHSQMQIENVAILELLQLEQFDHDEKYHREIARLSVQDRLKHMALHFAKYAGGLFAEDLDLARTQRLATDVFIISLSTINILNLKVSDALTLGQVENITDVNAFAKRVAILSGRIAAACEKMDHLEDYPFRAEIRDNTIRMFNAALSFIYLNHWNMPGLVRDRLLPIKQKSIFYGKL